jgi:hypothetical protein
MGSGWHEWPLVIFTVFGQCVVGAMVVMGIALIRENEAQARDRILRMMFFMWLVMGVGFIASVLHLGSPEYGLIRLLSGRLKHRFMRKPNCQTRPHRLTGSVLHTWCRSGVLDFRRILPLRWPIWRQPAAGAN